ncbi:hypothetical protein A9Q94_15765 [Rhodobacterales bacterium 56_14_T64]|nr:hypothetical protein A9Q94_15765 [Rhodobacterales bacterium 56_14_T64]
MATRVPETNSEADQVLSVSWAAIATGDTVQESMPRGVSGAMASVQSDGTFDGATVTLEGSNDGKNFVTLRDLSGADISFASAGLVDFSTSVVFIRPAISGGSADAVDVTLALRG